MNLTADQITIAVTVYNRRQFVRHAVASALSETVPVCVMVVEDCGPDAGMREFVEAEFKGRIAYIRNERRRGLFGNWNACLEYCGTGWLSILHDDDYVPPEFIAAMIELSRQAPDCGLYFGATEWVDEQGRTLKHFSPPAPGPWRRVRMEDTQWGTPFPYPGQVFRVNGARAAGGFRETSQYCGDWELWCQLIDRYGAAQTSVLTGYQRQHGGDTRGTNAIVRSGRQYPLSYVQRKRVLHLLRRAGRPQPLDRVEYQRRYPVAAGFLLRHGAGLSPRLFGYHWRLLMLSTPPHARHALFKTVARALGPRLLRGVSALYRGLTGTNAGPDAARSWRALTGPVNKEGAP